MADIILIYTSGNRKRSPVAVILIGLMADLNPFSVIDPFSTESIIALGRICESRRGML